VAGAVVRSSDEFGLGVNAVSEKREVVTTICRAVGDGHFEGLNKIKRQGGLGLELRDRAGARPIDRRRIGGDVPSRHRQVGGGQQVTSAAAMVRSIVITGAISLEFTLWSWIIFIVQN
jgi:hypothetical protein